MITGARILRGARKGIAALERSLTVLLPVQDAQATLMETVEEVLEAAADLTDRFELLIIDDGSADATGEIAHELTRHYPQIRTIRHSRPMGREAALRSGLAESRGEMVFVRDADRGADQASPSGGPPGTPQLSRPAEAIHPRLVSPGSRNLPRSGNVGNDIISDRADFACEPLAARLG